MTAAAIRAEVATALAEASAAVGDGILTVTLKKPTGGGSPWDADPASPTVTQHSLRAMEGAYRRDLIDGTLIQADDLRLYVEAGPVTPTTKDTLVHKGEEYAIVAVRPTSPGGEALMWELQVRR